jgi:hypothetical protein
MHTSAVETQALTHAQAIGFAMSLAGRVDSERRCTKCSAACATLASMTLLIAVHNGGNERHLHFRASHRFKLCVLISIPPIQAYLLDVRQDCESLISEIILAMALSPQDHYFKSDARA